MNSLSKDYRDIIEKLKKEIGSENLIGYEIPRPRRIWFSVRKEKLADAITHLVGEGFVHLSTITGLEGENGLEVIYHLNRKGLEASLKVEVSVKQPVLPTITPIIPGAILYEREVHELLGVVFSGHPNLSLLILPEDWPEGVYPLRKKWTHEEIKKKLLRRT
ncbi:NADH-quinone oxidoreductase subunit C [Candidatus Bathyarchaeota archaeon]|nr:MAG: NADH-quinone oxidoreductase subunit C [Candidatus Bathyarchaeota archaeon]